MIGWYLPPDMGDSLPSYGVRYTVSLGKCIFFSKSGSRLFLRKFNRNKVLYGYLEVSWN